MTLEKILESSIYKKIKPVNLKGNQPVTPAVSADASTESLQIGRTDASTAKVPNHGSSKQIVCSSTPGGSSERLNALCTLGPSICVAFSAAALEAKEGAFWALEEGDDSGIHWGKYLPSGTGKDRGGICGRELVTGVWEHERTSSA